MPKDKKKINKDKQALEEWASMLAKNTAEPFITAKEERVAKRAAKKRRREERLCLRNGQENSEETVNKKIKDDSSGIKRHAFLLNVISNAIRQSVDDCNKTSSKKMRPFIFSSSTKARNLKKSWHEESIQPRKKDYGGIGLARRSLFINFNDPSLIPKLEKEFAEHIPGFFGKQRTKAMKKQLGGNMLWRKLADSKMKEKKVDGKRLKDMSPDERVEAMIKMGLV